MRDIRILILAARPQLDVHRDGDLRPSGPLQELLHRASEGQVAYTYRGQMRMDGEEGSVWH